MIVDDILVWGCDTAEHDAKLEVILKRAREINLKLNIKKCKFPVARASREAKAVLPCAENGQMKETGGLVKNVSTCWSSTQVYRYALRVLS